MKKVYSLIDRRRPFWFACNLFIARFLKFLLWLCSVCSKAFGAGILSIFFWNLLSTPYILYTSFIDGSMRTLSSILISNNRTLHLFIPLQHSLPPLFHLARTSLSIGELKTQNSLVVQMIHSWILSIPLRFTILSLHFTAVLEGCAFKNALKALLKIPVQRLTK